ncbi:dnaJ homolog subfamily C member 11-like [Varroa jacobsoni]|uniref:J domain-containing protein n=1 Tax=Varroa destructor TaxID=109461 RepID=A0A7M7KTY4_VARDE|nr:dnaJ homolog subfamily C member 11-like [Varroa destructor]XP_022668793.1 dnaJ homolog subfamily C member 11-like [Varroa destructor]XP_022701318.1 dnaJ homolog subfamily C member 11-like [Varroa jacobsoni]
MAAPTDGQHEDKRSNVDDDYYATLNVSRTATAEEITAAFRMLSRVYHPDKHLNDRDKQNAEVLFNQIRHAHDVLADPQRRAIYDTLGSAGLEQSGWQITLRTKTAQEIREEYERLARQQEERRLQQRTNPTGLISMEVDATDMFDTLYDEEDDYDSEEASFFPHLEMGTMMIRQSVEAPLSEIDTTTLSGTLLTKNGRGYGTLAASWRHIFSNTLWMELTAGMGSAFSGSAKAVKTFDSKHFITAQVDLQPMSQELQPGVSMVLARQLSAHTIGYLTWREGYQQSMTATLAWSSNNTHISSNLQIGVVDSYVGISYVHKLWDTTKLHCSAKLGTIFMTVTYGCKTKISKLNTLGASMTVGHPQGVVLKVTFIRGNQTFAFPLQLSQNVNPSAILYGSVVPLIIYFVINKFAVEPYYASQKKAEAAKLREANRQKVAEQRKNAEASISLMRETYQRNYSTEENRSGLIIVYAEYGSAEELNIGSSSPDARSYGNSVSREVVSVTIPLQVLATNSRLVLGDTSKANLPGFYDPCPGEEKVLRIRYKYRNKLYEVTIKDTESLRIPMEKHLLRVT